MISASDAHNEPRVTHNPEMAAPYGLASARVGARRLCPVCNKALIRVWRRPIDRLSSKFVPVHRFRCEGFSCGWEGNLRVDIANPEERTSVLQRAAKVSVVSLMLVTSVALIVTVAIAVVGWISALDQMRDHIGLHIQPHEAVIQASADLSPRKEPHRQVIYLA